MNDCTISDLLLSDWNGAEKYPPQDAQEPSSAHDDTWLETVRPMYIVCNIKENSVDLS